MLDEVDPTELDARYMANIDKDIILTDMPERHQLRQPPVKASNSPAELRTEAQWIVDWAFGRKMLLSEQTDVRRTVTSNRDIRYPHVITDRTDVSCRSLGSRQFTRKFPGTARAHAR